MATTYIDTTSCNSDYIFTLPRTYSLGTYITIQDNGSNPSFFATKSIIIKTTPGYGFFDGSISESIRTSKGSLTFTAMTTAWRLVNTFAYTTSGNAVLSNVSTTHMFANSLSLSNLLIEGTLTAGAIDVQNAPTIQGIPVINTSNLISTTEGLGSLGFLSSVSFMNTTLVSTTNGLGGYGYISSTQLQSTLDGLGSLYLSTGGLTSTFQGIGGRYISTSGLVSSVQGLGTFGYISTASLTSTFQGLGAFYISTGSMTSSVSNIVFITSSNNQSTFRNLGSIYISTPSLVSTILGISNIYIVQDQLTSTNIGLSSNFQTSVVSTVAGLGTAGYISSYSLHSTVTALLFSNQSTVSFQLSSLGSLYISSLSLQSTVAGLASLPLEGYISTTQLTSTTTDLTASNRADLVSTVVNLGSLEYISRAQLVSTTTGITDRMTQTIVSTGTGMGSNYISSLSLQSTVAGLGTAGYISLSQLTSTTSNLAVGGSNSIVSTIAGLGSFYISVDQLTSTVTGFSNINQSNLISTVNTLGSNYISSLSLQSTVAGLGTAGYISLSQLTSTTSNLAFVGSNSIVSTIAGLGSFYISVDQLTSTVTGFSNINQSNLISTVNTLGSNYISTFSLVSTVAGLGTAGYISLSQLTSTTSNLTGGGATILASTIAGLGTSKYISVDQLTSTVTGFSNINQSNLISTVNTLGSNYISTFSLVSTVAGLGISYISLSQLTSTTSNLTGGSAITSTIAGLGTSKYISVSQLTSTVIGFSNTNQSNLISTVNTLGSNYISTFSLVSTVAGLGTAGYISLSQLTSTTLNLTGGSAITSTIAGLGTFYISVDQLTSTVIGFSNTNQYNLISTVNTLGSNYISTFSLVSTVAGLGTSYISLSQLTSTTSNLINSSEYIVSTIAGLGTSKYISVTQLTSTVTSFSNTNQSNLISTVNTLGSNYISTLSLVSTVAGLGTSYISLSQVTSTTSNLTLIGSNAIVSTTVGLGTFYISVDQLTSTVTGFSNTNRSNLISTVNTLGSNYISTLSLVSTVVGLGTTYISTPQLTSTTTGLPNPATMPASITPYYNTLGDTQAQVTTLYNGTNSYYSAITYTQSLLIYAGTSIFTNNYAGTQETTLISLDSSILGLATDGITVYATKGNKILSVNIANGSSSVLAGTDTAGFNDGSASTAQFNFIRGLALDSTYTNLYACDYGNGRLRKINLSSSTVSTVASNLTGIFDVAVDSLNEYVYITRLNNTLYKVTLSDGVSTPIGSFTGGTGLSLDSTTAYVTSSFTHQIYQINTTTGVATLLAGTGSPGSTDGSAGSASFNFPFALTFNKYDRSIYVADPNTSKIRKIILYTYGYISSLTLQATVANLGSSPYVYISTPSLVSTVAGLGTFGYLSTGYLVSTVSNLSNVSMTPFVSTTEGLGQIYISTSAVKNITPDSYKVSTLPFSVNSPIHIGCTSNLLVYTNSVNIFTFNGSSVRTLFGDVLFRGVACDLSNVYTCRSNQILSINLDTGNSFVLANTTNSGGFINGTNSTDVRFSSPVGLCIDSTYTYLYVCDQANNALRRIQLNPLSVTTVITSNDLAPNAVAVDSSNRFAYVVGGATHIYKVDLFQSNIALLYLNSGGGIVGISLDVTERFAYIPFVHTVSTIDLTTGALTAIAGSTAGNVDGYGVSAKFNSPYGVVYNRYDSSIYVCDYTNSSIRQITAPLYASTSVGLQSIQKVQTIAASNASLLYPVSSNVIANVPSLQLWLDGADPSGTGVRPANGATLTTWVDKSWNGYTQTKTGSPTYSNGQISVSSANYFTSSYITNYATQTIFLVGKGSDINVYTFFIRQSGGLGFQLVYWNNLLLSEQVFSGNVGNVSIQASAPINTTYLFTVTLTPTLMSLYVNGILAASNAITGTFPTTSQLIGSTVVDGSPATISEILMYNSALTASDRKGIEGYLMNKWLLQPYQPSLYPGLQLWLDGADPLGTGTPPGNGSITTWTDKSGNGYNGVATGSPTYTNGQVSISSTNYFTSLAVLTTNSITTYKTIFIVATYSTVNTTLLSENPTDDGSLRIYVTASGAFETAALYGGPYSTMTSSPRTTNIQYILSITISPSSSTLYINGILNASRTDPYYPFYLHVGTGTKIGGDIGSGTISELIMYSNALSTTQRQAIEQYLGVKWSINTVSLPLYYNGYTPTTFPGCRLWLDGADPLDGTIPAIGTNIITWADKSGQVTVTGNGSNTANGIRFTGVYGQTGYATNLNTNMSNQTTFSVFNATSNVDQSIIGTSGNASGIDVGINGTMQINLAYPGNDTNGIRVIKTLAGSFGIAGNVNSTGSNARFSTPIGLAVDSFSNVYVADNINHLIRKVTPAGVVSTYAGSTGGFADGALLSAQFSNPGDIAIDSSGNLYVADSSNFRIRKITSSTVTTIAGSNTAGIVNGIGTAARFTSPYSIAIDSLGNIYVAEYNNHIIRKIDTSSNVTTYAGTGSTGSENGEALTATFTNPLGIGVNTSGNVYVGTQHMIRKISPLSLNFTYNVTVPVYSLASVGSAMSFVSKDSNNVFLRGGPFNYGFSPTIYTSVYKPAYIAYDYTNNANSYILEGEYEPSTFAYVLWKYDGSGFQGIHSLGTASYDARFPGGLCVGTDNAVYYSYYRNYAGFQTNVLVRLEYGTWSQSFLVYTSFEPGRVYSIQIFSGNFTQGIFYFSTPTAIYKLTISGGIPTYLLVAGNSNSSGFVNGSGSSARFDSIGGFILDPVGNIYVADYNNSAVRVIDTKSNVTTFNTFSFKPRTVCISENRLYIGGDTGLVQYEYTVSTFAGSGSPGSNDGDTGASFSNIQALAVDSSTIYVADLNYKIRKIDSSGTVTTFAGSGIQDGTGADNLVLSARLNYPSGLAVRSGIVYFSERFAHTIRYTPIINYIVNGGTISVNSNTLFTSLVQTGVSNGVLGYINGNNVSQGSILDIFNSGGTAYIGMTYINPGAYMSKFFVGSIQEVIIYNKLLSMAQRKVIEFYLTQKWIPSYTTNVTKDTTSIPSTNSTSPAILLTSSNITVTEIDATGYTITAATFTASGGLLAGPNYGFYDGDGTYVTTISDRRLKEDIRNLTHALDKVSSMQAVNYRFYRDPSHQWIGYIAQDLELILPELVRTDDSPEQWKSIQYTYLPALIIEAVKELKEKYERIKHLLTV